MRVLEKVKTGDVVFLDIETVSLEENLVEDTPLYDAWSYKARYANELNRKTGLEYTLEEYFKEKAALYAPFAKIICITVGRIIEKSGEEPSIMIKSYSGDDEKALLEDFNNDLGAVCAKNPQTVLCGLNNIGFDEPFIFKRLIINGIKPVKLLDSSGMKPWEVTSIDLGKLFQGTSFYPDSLVAIATAMGLPSPKDGIDGSKVTEFYYAGKLDDIVKYCERDVITTVNIFRKFRFETVIEEVTFRKQKEKEIPAPIMQRLYMCTDFTKELSEEFRQLFKDKNLLEEDKAGVEQILIAHYIDKIDVMDMDKKEKKERNDEKIQEIKDFMLTL